MGNIIPFPEDRRPELLLVFLGSYGFRVYREFAELRKVYQPFYPYKRDRKDVQSRLWVVSDLAMAHNQELHWRIEHCRLCALIIDSGEQGIATHWNEIKKALESSKAHLFFLTPSITRINKCLGHVSGGVLDDRGNPALMLLTFHHTYLGCGGEIGCQCLVHLFPGPFGAYDHLAAIIASRMAEDA